MIAAACLRFKDNPGLTKVLALRFSVRLLISFGEKQTMHGISMTIARLEQRFYRRSISSMQRFFSERRKFVLLRKIRYKLDGQKGICVIHIVMKCVD